MAMNLNDGFEDDDDLLLDEEPSNEDEPKSTSAWVKASEEDFVEPEEEDETEEEVDAITQYLRDNGIEDKSKIKFENENGQIEERDWNDLSSQEQLNILRSNQRQVEDELEDEEIQLLNLLRANGLTPTDYQNYLVNQGKIAAQNEYKQYYENQLQKQEPTFTSDQLSDEELFILDLQSRVEDITEDEIKEALDQAKGNEDLFAKQMRGIRAEYQRLETEQQQREEAILQQQQQEAFEQYATAVNESIANLKNIGDLDIAMEASDMDELQQFILGQDEAGNNYFQQALSDPETLVQMAWFALHGEDIFNGISQYYNQQITEAQRQGYQAGLKAGQKSNKNETTVAYKPKQETKTVKTYKSVNDLFED